MLKSRPFLKNPPKRFPVKKTTIQEPNLVRTINTNVVERNLAFATDYNNLGFLKICPIAIPFHLVESLKKIENRVPEQSENWAGEYAKICDGTGLESIANFIESQCNEKEDGNLDDEEVMLALLSFVQDKKVTESLKYKWEGGDLEFPKYPLETLWDGSGDCEDLSILFASLATVLGYDVVLISILGYDKNGKRDENNDHVYAGVHLKKPPVYYSNDEISKYEFGGKIYYSCECTEIGWLIGDNPEEDSEFNIRHISKVKL